MLVTEDRDDFADTLNEISNVGDEEKDDDAHHVSKPEETLRHEAVTEEERQSSLRAALATNKYDQLNHDILERQLALTPLQVSVSRACWLQ